MEAGQPRDLFNALSGSKGTWGPARTRAVTRDHRMSRAERLGENGIASRSAVDGDNVWTRRRWLQLPALGAATLRGVPRVATATRVAEEPAWSGSLRGGPMSSWALREPGSRVWTNGRFRNVGCALQPSSDKKREENPGGHVLPRL